MKNNLKFLMFIIGYVGFSCISLCQARSRLFSSENQLYENSIVHDPIEGSLVKKSVKVPIVSYVSTEKEAFLTPYKMGNFFKKIVVDSRDIVYEIGTQTTLKIIAGFLPFYLIGRKVDERAHAAFYNGDLHRNINQPSTVVTTLLNDGVYALPFIFLGGQALFNSDPYERRVGQIFALGTFYTWATKVLIKEIEVEAALRPLNEHFKPSPRVHGGNPSGHTAIITFLATYYGLYKGKKYGVPCALYAGLAGSLLIATNRHYVSQVIAGAGLGMIFGFAAHKVRLNLTDNYSQSQIAFGPTSDSKGRAGISFSYLF